MDPFMSSQRAVLERYHVICCTATRNQTFIGGEEKLLFSCANFVDQTKTPKVNAENLTFIISMVGSMFGYCPTYSRD